MLYPVRKTRLSTTREEFYAQCDEVQKLKNAGKWDQVEAAGEKADRAYGTWQDEVAKVRQNSIRHTPQDCYQPGWRDPYRLRRD